MRDSENDIEAHSENHQLISIKDSVLNFEDQMCIENKGYASLIELLGDIKELKEFNSRLHLLLMERTPYRDREAAMN
jgi:hypothetical protein